MAVVIASNLRKELAGTVLFDGVSFSVERRDRVALSGPNGAGKTTLLRILAGETEKHGGELAFQKGTRVALHDQRPPLERGLSLREYVLSGARDLVATEEELARLEQAMAGGAHDQATHEPLRRGAGAARARRRLRLARPRDVGRCAGSASRTSDLDRPLRTFSGGELTRASLARALGGDPDLLLLDEPTNHLDVASLEWLERELQSLDAAVILVAHDRWFLEAVTTATLELEAGRAHVLPRPVARLAAREGGADAARAEGGRARRRTTSCGSSASSSGSAYKKNKAKQAQAKLTQIGRLEKERADARGEIALLTRRARTLGFEFLKPPRSGRTVVEVDGLERRDRRQRAAARRRVVRDRARRARRARRAERLRQDDAARDDARPPRAGDRPRAARPRRRGRRTSRSRRWSSTRAAPCSQCVQSMTGLSRPDAQNLLGRFLFSGWDEHEKPVAVLSGGERRRLALAVAVASGANFLVLDEPTNHLDLESREALEAALDAFPGTVLLVSHDRALLDAVAERTLAIEDGELHSYDGGWAEMLRRARGARAATPAPPKPKRKEPKPKPREAARRSRPPASSSGSRPRSPRARPRSPTLEAKLAEDWANVEMLAAHKRAATRSRRCSTRWEQLFERRRPSARVTQRRVSGDLDWYQRTAVARERSYRCRMTSEAERPRLRSPVSSTMPPRAERLAPRRAGAASPLDRVASAAHDVASRFSSAPSRRTGRRRRTNRAAVVAATWNPLGELATSTPRASARCRSPSAVDAAHLLLLRRREPTGPSARVEYARSGPEGVERRVERHGRHLLPQAVLDRMTSAWSTSRSMPLRVPYGAVDRRPPTRRSRAPLQRAAVRPAGLEPVRRRNSTTSRGRGTRRS